MGFAALNPSYGLPRFLPTRASLPRLLEIAQIRRCLVLFGGHQESFRAQEIVFLADDDLRVALGAKSLAPVWMRIRVAPECLVDDHERCRQPVQRCGHL